MRRRRWGVKVQIFVRRFFMRPRRFHAILFAFASLFACINITSAQTPPATRRSPVSRPAFRTGILRSDHNPALPTLFLIGDSTVKNSWDEGDGKMWGWGHPIAAYFDPTKINVENQALGGTSSRSYITGGNWPRVLPLIHSGDFVIMQFGHNDGPSTLKGNGEETEERAGRGGGGRGGQKETVHTFGWYIREYISDTKAKGATPIVCSLIPRNQWKDGKVNRGTDSYATWAGEAAKMGGADFIDLNGLIADHYDKLGEEAVKAYFPSAAEHTHTNWDGSVLNAQCVIEGIKSLKDCQLNNYLSANPEPKKPVGAP
jgi:lysophospholipase L1-like esterase